MKKRLLQAVSTVLLVLLLATGCKSAPLVQDAALPTPDGTNLIEKISVVSTIFPPYDFVREIAGENVALTMLLPPGAESHSFEPTPKDIITIQNCDVFLYVGGDSDAWIDDILDSMDTSNIHIIRLMDLVTTVEEEIVDGMEDDHGHNHDHEDFDPSDVKDRPLADWQGDWQSILPYLSDGSLDDFVAHAAEEDGISSEEAAAAYAAKWQTDYKAITIAGDTVSFDGTTAQYSYAGYTVVESDHGTSVWYQFQISAPVQGLPAYLAFSDHEIGGEHEHEDEEEGARHFHLRYGNDGFPALIAIEEWSPTFFDASANKAAILDALSAHGHSEEAEETEAAEYDEHVWTSLKNAQLIVSGISQALCEVDAANKAAYEKNTEAYLAKLQELDAAFQAVVDNAARSTIVFGDRFPFRYFADAYGLTYFAAFPGCSTETEASAGTVAFLIDKIKAEQLPVVFHIELSNEKMADSIAEATGAKKLLLHACHNISKADFERGATYLELMNSNVSALKEALS